MLNHDYWSRVWIQQEIVCSRLQKVIIHYEKESIPLLLLWRFLGALLYIYNNTRPPTSIRLIIDICGSFFVGLDGLACISANQDISGRNSISSVEEIWHFIYNQYFKRVIDPRDKIYGLYGLICPWGSGSLKVDYEAPIAEVYSQAQKILVETFQSCKIFTWNTIPRRYRDLSLPSLCLDLNHFISWDELRIESDNTHSIVNLPHLLTLRANGKKFQAAAGKPASCKLSADSRILSATGFYFASVKELGKPLDKKFHNSNNLENLNDDVHMFLAALKVLIPVALKAVVLYGSLEETLNALWRTLCTDRPRTNREHPGDFAPDSYGYAFHLLCDIHAWFQQRPTTYLTRLALYEITDCYPLDLKPPRGLNRDSIVQWLVDFIDEFVQTYRETMRQRKFCFSGVGFGLVPMETEIGDILCVLLGCPVPVVLRKEGEYYKFIGEAYVFGWMFGRGLDEEREGRLKREVFHIC